MIKRIIIAEDNALVRAYYLSFIKNNVPNVEIEEVEDGKTLVDSVRAYDWDFVLTDVRMKGLGGIEAVRQIRGFNTKVPIAIVSGYDAGPYLKAMERLGAYFIQKDTYEQQLLPLLKQHLA